MMMTKRYWRVGILNYWSDLFSRFALLRLFESLFALLSRSSISCERLGSGGVEKKGEQSFSEIIKRASEKYYVDERLISAVIKHESSFNPRAVSPCGAQGLMQLMPATARALGVTDPFDAEQNIMAGTRYLRQKIDEFDGNLQLALAAYNAGSGAVRRYGGIPPYPETQTYVRRVMKSYLA
ncbi:MAG TPA: lytic transglycosylase domain-containing protein [Syntrophomonadaceae bacterium]|nr:lytic transglycosylase domain-containing protein [Syntrophomonadaceae bacterium]